MINKRKVTTHLLSLTQSKFCFCTEHHFLDKHGRFLFTVNSGRNVKGEGQCFKNQTQGTTQTLLKSPKIPNAFKQCLQTPLLLQLITVSVSTRVELGRSGKPLIPPSHSPMNVWLMPAGCHHSKIWFFPLMEMTDDNAPGEPWLPFRCLHVALIARLMESAWKWGLSIHLVSPERVSRTAELSFLATQPLRGNSGSVYRTSVKTFSSCHFCSFLPNGVLITIVVQTAPWTPTAPKRKSQSSR